MKLTNVKINPVYNSYDDDIIEDLDIAFNSIK